MRNFSANKKSNININKGKERNVKTIIKNLRCPNCGQIFLININKDNFTISFQCKNNCNNKDYSKINLFCSKIFSRMYDNSYVIKSDINCQKHPELNNYSYCVDCNKNICIECLKSHSNHVITLLNKIKPKNNEVFAHKIKIREKYEKFQKVKISIAKWKNEFEEGIDSLLNVVNNIYNYENFIVLNYDKLNNNNYNYIQNYNLIKKLDLSIPELEEFFKKSDWIEKGKILMEAVINMKKILDQNLYEKNNKQKNTSIININNERENRKNDINNKNGNIQKQFSKTYNKNKDAKKNNYIDNCLSTIKENEQLRKNPINLNMDKNLIKKIYFKNKDLNEENNKIEKEINDYNKQTINKNNSLKEKNNNFDINIDLLNIQNIDNNTTPSIPSSANENNEINESSIYQSNNILNNARIENNTNESLNKDNLKLKFELAEYNIIKSIEFINDNQILVCTSRELNIYNISSNLTIDREYSIKESDNIINYASKLTNGNLIICLSNSIKIIKILKEKHSNKYEILQELKPKNKCLNIIKAIEIKNNNNYIISCAQIYLTIYERNKDFYHEIGNIKAGIEIKCIENINDKCFATIQPKRQTINFYDIADFENNCLVLRDIQTSYGRYILKFIEKFNSIFVAGIYGIYLISAENYQLISFFKTDEWISSINYNSFNNCIICGSYKENIVNNNKSYDLIIFSLEEENIKDNCLNNINLIEEERKKNIHLSDIMVINSSKNGIIITGSNDKYIKIWE